LLRLRFKTKNVLACGILNLVISLNAVALPYLGQVSSFVRNEQMGSIVIKMDRPDPSLAVGDVMVVHRGFALADGNAVEVGAAKITAVNGKALVASVVREGGDLAEQLLRKHRHIMAGDKVSVHRPDLMLNHAVITQPIFTYDRLFINPTARSSNYELSDQGKARLIEAAAPLIDQAHGRIMVEAHTDDNGPERRNQIESTNRALSVKLFLQAHFGLANERMIAIGLGESQRPDQARVPGYARRHRRVILKVVSDIAKN
jgi:hypothetical protein